MSEKFAIIRFAKDLSEIPIKLMPLLKGNKRISHWYVGKFLPYAISDIELSHVSGYEIVLPMTDAKDTKLLQRAAEKIAAECHLLGIAAVMFPGDLPAFSGFFTPRGNFIKFFLIKDIISRYVKKSSKDFKNIEAVIIEGNFYETKSLARLIYSEFNFLSIILEESSATDYEPLADFIFSDCGLNLSFGGRGSSLLKEADIVINLSQNKKGYDTHLKKNACYIELSAERTKIDAMSLRRKDIVIIDDFTIESADAKMPAKLYEMLFYCKSREFSKFIHSGGKYGDCGIILNLLKANEAKAKNLNI